MNLGINQNGNEIFITEEARKANLAVYGIKNTGKAYTLIPYLLEQDLARKNTGITIIVDSPGLSWFLYALARIKNRKAEIIKPSINMEVMNKLLFRKEWNYDEIKQIYDFEKAINSKTVTIIDMEQEKWGDEAVRAVSMLMLQLQSDMVKASKVNHAVYIDNAADFVPYIKNLLKYGDYYNFSTVLFFKSRNEMQEKSILVDNYVRNTILLQGLTFEDAKYFGERLNLSGNIIDSTQDLLNRDYKEFTYEILAKGFKRETGCGLLVEMDEELKKECLNKAEYYRRRNKDVIDDDQHLQFEREKEKLELKEDPKKVIERIEEKVPKTADEIFKETKKQNKKAKITKVEGEQPQLNKMRKTTDIKFDRQQKQELPKEITPLPEIDDNELDLSALSLDEEFPEMENLQTEEEFEIPDEPFVPEEDFAVDNPTVAELLSNDPATENSDDTDFTINLDEPAEEKPKKYINLSGDDDDDVVKLRSSGLRPYQKIVNRKVKNKFNRYF